jgi:DNA-binding transcriptional ArsR family regulator
MGHFGHSAREVDSGARVADYASPKDFNFIRRFEQQMSLDRIDESLTQAADQTECSTLAVDQMTVHAMMAAGFLKALSHEGRLMILCHLSSGEKSVTELEQLLSTRQAAVSQQLARLRLEGLVSCRRDGKAMFYSIQDPKVGRMIELVYDMFCRDQTA